MIFIIKTHQGETGLYVYDLSNVIPGNKCSLWYYSKLLSPTFTIPNPFNSGYDNKVL